MNDSFTQFAADRLAFAGLAGWCARWADSSGARHSNAPWLAPGQADQTLARVAISTDAWKQHLPGTRKLCWVFEHVRLFAAIRPDKALLLIWIVNQPDWPASEVDKALEAFLGL